MKITDIEAIPVAPGPGYAYAVIVVLVRTDEGLTGIGEASLGGRGRGVLGIIDHSRELLIGQDPGQDRALLGRAGARHLLVDRSGHHERRRRDRPRALGHQGQAARCSRLRPARRADARPGACLPPPERRHLGGAGRGRPPLERGRASPRCGTVRWRRSTRKSLDALESAAGDRGDDQGDRGVAPGARRRRRPAARRAHDVQPDRDGVPGARARAVSSLLLRGPDPAVQCRNRCDSCATRPTCRSRPASNSRTSGSSKP